MSYQCDLIEGPAQSALSVRVKTSVQNLPQEMGKAYGAIGQYLGELGKQPAGAPFAAYYNMDMQNLDVEIGFPVKEPLPAKGDIQASTIPGGKKATCLHLGPYDAIEPAYEAIMKWMKDNGYEATGVSYEFYLNDPNEVSPKDLKTQIAFPLK
jgi:effector-binding domain-containing protein